MHQKAFFYKTLGEQSGLSLKQVGTLLGIDPTLLIRIENKIRPPNREQLIKLAVIYDYKKILEGRGKSRSKPMLLLRLFRSWASCVYSNVIDNNRIKLSYNNL